MAIYGNQMSRCGIYIVVVVAVVDFFVSSLSSLFSTVARTLFSPENNQSAPPL